MAEPTEQLHTYHGNCHCGAFKFAVKLPEVNDVYACNCSICVRVSWCFPLFLRFKRSWGNEKSTGKEVSVRLLPLMVAGWLLLFLPWPVS
jgi:hypothetical protein